MNRSINLPQARRRAAARGKAASGKFVRRLEPQFHADLRREATRHGLSLNEHCAQVMAVHRAAGDAAEISGTWAEAATDGIVLFERGLDLSRRLSGIRRRIAAGEIVRHVANGQPYWVRGE